MAGNVTALSTTAAVDRVTLWCHECDMSVTLLSPDATSPLLCPHCNSDFLEELDSSFPNAAIPNPNPASSLVSPPQPSAATTSDLDVLSAADFPFPPAAASDDNFLLDSPYIHHLIQHLNNSDSSSTTGLDTIPRPRNRRSNPFRLLRSAVRFLRSIRSFSALSARNNFAWTMRPRSCPVGTCIIPTAFSRGLRRTIRVQCAGLSSPRRVM